MNQFSLEQLAAALSALGISVPIMDFAVGPASHAQDTAAGPMLTFHCSQCAFPNAVSFSAVPTIMGIPLPSSRSGGCPVPRASDRVPSAPTMTAPLPYTRTQVAAPASAAHLSHAPAPIANAPVAPATVTPAPVTPAPVIHAPIAPAPIIPAPIVHTPVAPALVHAPIAPAPVVHTPIAPAPGPSQSAPVAAMVGPDGPWYVVSKGRSVGIYQGWQNVSSLVTRVGHACFFRCDTRAAAQAAFDEVLATGAVEIL
ncbi:uncharacterized protein ARMOST_15947 [Armillaria ostoyae]|uniref:Ribonuclease H1 N-terminal domain-containing protein n=1 Tax=Armillaria ostoyae TaxID=47428 RepID=A0A284RUV3_ARMOS|nr:uncharacterized protein ARMOST_15947 [Armillaria ostoyae]